MPVTTEANPGKGARTGHVLPVALRVRGDEKAWMLVERSLLTTDYKELRRWQFIYVNRGDQIAEWCQDLGLASQWPDVTDFRLVSMWEDSVDELMDQATAWRHEQGEFHERLLEYRATSTLIPEWLALIDEKRMQRRNQSTFGPGFTRQRNLFASRRRA